MSSRGYGGCRILGAIMLTKVCGIYEADDDDMTEVPSKRLKQKSGSMVLWCYMIFILTYMLADAICRYLNERFKLNSGNSP